MPKKDEFFLSFLYQSLKEQGYFQKSIFILHCKKESLKLHSTENMK